MSQHWEDRDPESRQAFLRVLEEADSGAAGRRPAIGKSAAIGVILGVLVSVAMVVSAYLAGPL